MTSPVLRPPVNRADPKAVPWWSLQQAMWVVPALAVFIVLGLLVPAGRWWFLWPSSGLHGLRSGYWLSSSYLPESPPSQAG